MKFVPIAAALLLALPLPLSLTTRADAADFRCDGRAATLVGTSGDDLLTGTAGNDVIVGRGGVDTIDGKSGQDVICGGRGRDLIDGGPDDDRVYGGSARDRLSGGPGDDHLTGGMGAGNLFDPGPGDDTMNARDAYFEVDYAASPGPVSVDLAAGTASGWGTDTFHILPDLGAEVTGSVFGDTLLGTSFRDWLVGNRGYDMVDPADGLDTIDGRGGEDAIFSSAGNLSGGEGNDTIGLSYSAPAPAQSSVDGGPGNDVIRAPEAVGRLDAGEGDDQVTLDVSSGVGAAGPDLAGGGGHDLLWLFPDFQTPGSPLSLDLASGAFDLGGTSGMAAAFEDFYIVGEVSSIDITGTDGPNRISLIGVRTTGPAVVHALGGDDSVSGDVEHATFDGGTGDDELHGSNGDDTIDGSTGNDTITGADGDDVIDGGPGTDTADGGDGADTCIAVENPTRCETLAP
jgi:Ca2+-binding RTX toxin-like protein